MRNNRFGFMFDLSLVWAYTSTTRALDIVPKTQVAFPRWTAIKLIGAVEGMTSPDCHMAIRRPISLIRTMACLAHAPDVSMATDDILVLVTLSYFGVSIIIIIIILHYTWFTVVLSAMDCRLCVSSMTRICWRWIQFINIIKVQIN